MKGYISLVALKHVLFTKERGALKLEIDCASIFNGKNINLYTNNPNSTYIYVPGRDPKYIISAHKGDVISFGAKRSTYITIGSEEDLGKINDRLNQRALYLVKDDQGAVERVDSVGDLNLVKYSRCLADISKMVLSEIFDIKDELILNCLNYSHLLDTHTIIPKENAKTETNTKQVTDESGTTYLLSRSFETGLCIYNPDGKDFCIEFPTKMLFKNITKAKFEILVHKDLLPDIPTYILEALEK